MNVLRSLGLAASVTLVTAHALSAQIRASERSTLVQVVDGTRIEVDYARPRVRGRSPIWGGRVHWGEVWTPGANMATTFTVDRPVRLADRAVGPGTYSLWFVVDSTFTWEVVLDPEAELYHEQRPDARAGQVRFPVQATRTDSTEVLTFTFPTVSATGTTLRFAWADREVRLPIVVEPSLPPDVSAAEAAPYEGEWTVRWPSADAAWDDTTLDTTMEIRREDGVLVAHWDPIFWGSARLVWLIPVADGWFTPAIIRDGEIFDVFREYTFEFAIENGRATRFELRLPDDDVAVVGERTGG